MPFLGYFNSSFWRCFFCSDKSISFWRFFFLVGELPGKLICRDFLGMILSKGPYEAVG